MQNETDRVAVEFMVRPNSLPFAIGLVVLGIVVVLVFFKFKNPMTGGGAILFVGLLASAFILLGIWFLFAILVRRKETPRSLSAQGVEIRGRTMVPWANVSLIEQKPPTYPNGELYEQTVIKFDNGKTVSVSSDWVSNFFEVNEYLVKKSHEAGIKIPEAYPARPVSIRGGESPMTASPTAEENPSTLQQSQTSLSEMGEIAVEFSMAQNIYVIIFTPGLIIFGIYFLSLLAKPSANISGWFYFVLLLIPIAFIILGVAFPFLMSRGRRRVARSFSAKGVELWNGSVVPWNEVSVIAGGTQFIRTGASGGTGYRKLDIKFRDGSGVYVSGYWATNLSELENYLAQMPQYSP